MTDFTEVGPFSPPRTWEALKRPILNRVKVAFRVENTEVIEKVEILQVVLVLQVASWKNIHNDGGKKQRFFSLFSLWSYLLKLSVKLSQTLKEQDFNFLRSSNLFWEQPQGGVLEVNCQAFNLTLLAFLRILATFSRLVLTNLLKFLK